MNSRRAITRTLGLRGLIIAAVVSATATASLAAPPPKVETTLRFKPAQQGVDIETPTSAEIEKCRVEPAAGNSGWIVYGAGGQVIRKFLDADGDGTVDTRKFYNLGMEVYRDIDTNKNNKIDQSRWLNIGGAKWGVDSDENGKIDRWLVISAEEAALEAVSALVSQDDARLSAVMLSAADIQTIGLSADLATEIREDTSGLAARIKSTLGSTKVLTQSSRWLRFDPQSASIVPKDEGKANQDLMILGNPMALIRTGEKDGIVQLGEMVRVGNTWKLTSMPVPIEGNDTVVGQGRIMKPEASKPGEGGLAYSPEIQKLLKSLQDIDEEGPGTTQAERTRYHNRRAGVLKQMIGISKTEEERDQWNRQLADGLALAVQSGGFPAGLEQLKQLESQQYKANPKSALMPYITFRRISADYSQRLQTANDDKRQEAQKWYSQQLQGYWKSYPQAEDTPDVLFQLALGNEYQNNVAEAKKWYGQLERQFGRTLNGKKGAGALRRLSMEGKPFELSGPSIEGGNLSIAEYKGKVTLVVYWGTWCTPCTADMPFIVTLHKRYKKQGFEVMGINMDKKGSESRIAQYKKSQEIEFRSLSEPGGLDGGLALQYGVVSAPTMFLIGRDGRVLRRSTSISDLKRELPGLLK